MRFYFAEIVAVPEDGPNSFGCSIHEYVRTNDTVDCRSMNTDGTIQGGHFLVAANPTEAEHMLIKADPRITYIPLEDADGNALELTDTVSQISAAKRTAISNAAEAKHIPMDGITGSTTIASLLLTLRNRLRLRQILRHHDFIENMGDLVSSIPSARRQAITQRLTERGYDPSVITLDMTVRQALGALMQ